MPRFGFISTYPPTHCGLATFTEALATAMVGPSDTRSRIVRMMDDSDGPAPELVGSRSTIVGELYPGDGPRDAVAVLDDCDAVIVQHEYGIYGGRDGDEIVPVLAAIAAPAIVVLHTVLPDPTPHQKLVLEQVAAEASIVVVMTLAAHALLTEIYAVDESKVRVIPHGVGDWQVGSEHLSRTTRTMLTWGLIGPGKGIEWGIRAMALLAEQHPTLRYVVAGQTHPKVLAHEGEHYRQTLEALIEEHGLTDRVTLDDRYLDRAQLAALVGSAEIVLLPYDSRDQATSGVLTEAVAAGRHVIATGFPHATEVLARTGHIVEHEDPEGIAAAVAEILARAPRAGRRNRYGRERSDSWATVAERYRRLSARLGRERTA